MAKPNKRWPPNVGVNNGRVRYRKKVPPDVQQTYGKRLYVEYLDLDESASYDQAFKAHRIAYGERVTEAQERQLERRLTKLCQMD